jgi:hypothetical protein
VEFLIETKFGYPRDINHLLSDVPSVRYPVKVISEEERADMWGVDGRPWSGKELTVDVGGQQILVQVFDADPWEPQDVTPVTRDELLDSLSYVPPEFLKHTWMIRSQPTARAVKTQPLAELESALSGRRLSRSNGVSITQLLTDVLDLKSEQWVYEAAMTGPKRAPRKIINLFARPPECPDRGRAAVTLILLHELGHTLPIENESPRPPTGYGHVTPGEANGELTALHLYARTNESLAAREFCALFEDEFESIERAALGP